MDDMQTRTDHTIEAHLDGILHDLEPRLEQKLLGTVADLMAGSFEDVLRELLHNARRAGATRIDITTLHPTEGEEYWGRALARNPRVNASTRVVIVTDNGHGIIDPTAVLRYGSSCWLTSPDEADPKEPCAGVGLLAGANGPMVITTRPAKDTGVPDTPWCVMMGPKNFRGQCRTVRFLDRLAPKPHGTSVSIVADGVKEWALEDLVRFFPVPVRINDRDIPQTLPLDGATRTFEHEGAVIGLFEGPRQGEPSGLIYWNGTTDPLHVPVETTTTVRVDASAWRQLKLTRPGYHPADDKAKRALREVITKHARHGG
ncbi:MAG: hypothetical protein OXC00_03440 [Acidimicrobiaceae bacterium]|nr:hypothetical protein [Acidimicrobiaceae bacterium]